MRTSIDSRFLGTPVSLIVDSDGTLEWSNAEVETSLSSHSWHSAKLEDIFILSGLEHDMPKVADQAHTRAFEALGVSVQDVSWMHALGRVRFLNKIKNVVRTIS